MKRYKIGGSSESGTLPVYTCAVCDSTTGGFGCRWCLEERQLSLSHGSCNIPLEQPCFSQSATQQYVGSCSASDQIITDLQRQKSPRGAKKVSRADRWRDLSTKVVLNSFHAQAAEGSSSHTTFQYDERSSTNFSSRLHDDAAVAVERPTSTASSSVSNNIPQGFNQVTGLPVILPPHVNSFHDANVLSGLPPNTLVEAVSQHHGPSSAMMHSFTTDHSYYSMIRRNANCPATRLDGSGIGSMEGRTPVAINQLHNSAIRKTFAQPTASKYASAIDPLNTQGIQFFIQRRRDLEG